MFPRHLLVLAALVCASFACAEARAAVVVATVKGTTVSVYAAPGGREIHRLASPDGYGIPRVLLVTDRHDGWLRTLLPVRPNGLEILGFMAIEAKNTGALGEEFLFG